MNDRKIFAALADPTRRALFEQLVRAPRSVGDLVASAQVSQPGVSQHLRVLREAGLVEVERRGALRIYRARPHGLAPLSDWLSGCLDRIGPKATA